MMSNSVQGRVIFGKLSRPRAHPRSAVLVSRARITPGNVVCLGRREAEAEVLSLVLGKFCGFCVFFCGFFGVKKKFGSVCDINHISKPRALRYACPSWGLQLSGTVLAVFCCKVNANANERWSIVERCRGA